jgi:SAM-dependent methyltransferase
MQPLLSLLSTVALLALAVVPAAACKSPAPQQTQQVGPSQGAGADAPEANRDRHGPGDVNVYIANLQDNKREGYLPTRRLVELLKLKADAVVADLGCGPGVVTSELARAVPSGIVYAVDLEPRQLDAVNARIRAEKLQNVVPVLCVDDDSRLPRAAVDCVVIVDTYHHFDHRVEYLRRLRNVLKPGGRIVNVDFKDGKLPVGPPESHRIPRAVMLQEFSDAGFSVAREEREFPYHDYIVFTPRN